MADVYDQILDAVVSELQGETFDGLDSENIVKRELPLAQGSIETLPCIVVAPRDGEKIQHAAFGYQVFNTYQVDVVIIAADNASYKANLTTYLTWRKTAREKFLSETLAGVTEVWKTRVLPQFVLDRNKLNQNYAYQGFTLEFTTIERRPSPGD